MKIKPQRKIVSDFFLDGAKIIFGSLVVGVFIPGAAPQKILWPTLAVGITMTTLFLIIANFSAEGDNMKENSTNL